MSVGGGAVVLGNLSLGLLVHIVPLRPGVVVFTTGSSGVLSREVAD